MQQQASRKPNLTTMTRAWTSMTTRFFRGAIAANQAAISAMMPSVDLPRSWEKEDTIPTSIPSVAYEHGDWEFNRTVDHPDHITVGDEVMFSKTLSDDDVRAFARVTGDTNRLHLDEEFAEDTRFGGRIVHGTLVAGLISAALARLPGLTIYISQDLKFHSPVRIGEFVSAHVEIVEDLGEDQFRLETHIREESTDSTVIDGEAVVVIDDFPPE